MIDKFGDSKSGEGVLHAPAEQTGEVDLDVLHAALLQTRLTTEVRDGLLSFLTRLKARGELDGTNVRGRGEAVERVRAEMPGG